MKDIFIYQIQYLVLLLIFIILTQKTNSLKFKSSSTNISVFDAIKTIPSSSSIFSHIDTHYEANFSIKPGLVITECTLMTDPLLCVNNYYCAWDNLISKCVDSTQNEISHKDNNKIYFKHN